MSSLRAAGDGVSEFSQPLLAAPTRFPSLWIFRSREQLNRSVALWALSSMASFGMFDKLNVFPFVCAAHKLRFRQNRRLRVLAALAWKYMYHEK